MSKILIKDFYNYFKEITENMWSDYPEWDLEQSRQYGRIGSSWKSGTKWKKGLSNNEIIDIQKKWNIVFPEPYVTFLKTLNTPNREVLSFGYFSEKAYEVEQGPDQNSFYNWLNEKESIRDALAWPIESLSLALKEDSFWLNTWGIKPKKYEDQFIKLKSMIDLAPKLIPIIDHRYMVDYKIQDEYPIISMYGADIICYGLNLYDFLRNEMESDFNDAFEDFVFPEKFSPLFNAKNKIEDLQKIPFWGDFIK